MDDFSNTFLLTNTAMVRTLKKTYNTKSWKVAKYCDKYTIIILGIENLTKVCAYTCLSGTSIMFNKLYKFAQNRGQAS